MAGYRSLGQSSGITRLNLPGDTPMIGLDTQSVAITGGVTLTAANILSGVLFLTGTGGVTVTLPNASDVYNALVGNGVDPDFVAGMGFMLDVVNNSSGTATFASSADGSNVQATFALATTLIGKMSFKFTNIQKPTVVVVQTVNGDDDVTLKFNNPAQTAAPIGPAFNSVNLTPGAWVGKVATVLASGASILSVAQSPGGVTGFKMSANAVGSVAMTASIGPVIAATGLYKIGPS